MLQNAGVLYILTYKCAWRHSGVQFLDIWPSKSGPNMWCFAHFYLQMCFAPQPRQFFDMGASKIGPAMRFFAQFDLQMCFGPQRRAIFRHRSFKNRSSNEVFFTVWLEMCFATAACHFHLSARTGTSAPAALARLLFERQRPRIIEKTERFATSLTFRARVPAFYWLCSARAVIFFILILHACWSSFGWLDISTLLLHSADLASLLCFSTRHIVGS